VSNVLLVTLKLIVGLFFGLVSVLSEALHSLMDLLAAVIANYSVRKAVEPCDTEHPYGHGKYENLSGVIEAILIFIAAGIIIIEAGQKLAETTGMPEVDLGIVVMGISVLVNLVVSRYLYKVAKEEDSMALEADALHLKTDVWTSLGIFAGLVAMKLTGIRQLDPIIALGVALFIIKAAWDMLKRSGRDLLDEKLPPEDEEKIKAVLNKHSDKFLGYHNLRTRKAGGARFVDFHIVIKYDTPVETGHALAGLIKSEIKKELKNCDVIVHVEPCDKDCCFMVNGEKVCVLDGNASGIALEGRCVEREKPKGEKN
jgi:cation diffusion facilitator family transporter